MRVRIYGALLSGGFLGKYYKYIKCNILKECETEKILKYGNGAALKRGMWVM